MSVLQLYSQWCISYKSICFWMLLEYSEMRNLHAHFHVNLGNHRDNVSGSRSLKKAMSAERFWGWNIVGQGLGIMQRHESGIIWSNYSDLTRPHPKWWFSKGNPFISGKSRLVKSLNLASFHLNECWNGPVVNIDLWPKHLTSNDIQLHGNVPLYQLYDCMIRNFEAGCAPEQSILATRSPCCI